jgi:hypothetical protein
MAVHKAKCAPDEIPNANILFGSIFSSFAWIRTQRTDEFASLIQSNTLTEMNAYCCDFIF